MPLQFLGKSEEFRKTRTSRNVIMAYIIKNPAFKTAEYISQMWCSSVCPIENAKQKSRSTGGQKGEGREGAIFFFGSLLLDKIYQPLKHVAT